MSLSAAGGYQKVPPWSKGYGGYHKQEYNYYNQYQKHQQESYHKKGGDDWYNNKRKKIRKRGREYVYCTECKFWDWASAWFPKCSGCGKPWCKPGGHNHDSDDDLLAVDDSANHEGYKDKAKDKTPEEREKAALLCKALSEALGTDLSGLLAKHLPAVQPPKSEKEQENQVWIELRDARRTVDRTSGKLRQSTKSIAQLREKLAAEEDKHNDLIAKNTEAEEKRHNILQSYFASYGREFQERAEEEAGLREPKRKAQRRGGLDDDEHDPMHDIDREEQEAGHEGLPNPTTQKEPSNEWRATRSRSPAPRGSASAVGASSAAGAEGMGNLGGISG